LELPNLDLDSNQRIFGNRVDIGAFEYQGNSLVKIFPIPDQTGKEDSLFELVVFASGSPLPALSLISSPPGMTIDPSGKIQWVPDNASGGNYIVQIEAANTNGGDSVIFPLTILNNFIPPEILAPTIGDTVNIDDTLAWDSSLDPDLKDSIFYKIQFSIDSVFNVTLLEKDSLALNNLGFVEIEQAQSLFADKVIFWRIEGFDQSGYRTGYSPGPNWFNFVDLSTKTITPLLKKPFIDFSISQNFPNPFTQTTTFTFSVPKVSKISLSIFDLQGQKIKTIFSGLKNPGIHTINWDRKNSKGQVTPSGNYLLKLNAREKTTIRKIALLH